MQRIQVMGSGFPISTTLERRLLRNGGPNVRKYKVAFARGSRKARILFFSVATRKFQNFLIN